MTDLTLLASHRVFKHLSAPERQSLMAQMRIDQHPGGADIADGDAMDDTVFWMVSGQVAMVDAEGRVLFELGSGELFGAGFGPGLAVHKAVAVTPSRVATIAAAALSELAGRAPALRHFLPAALLQTHGAPPPGDAACSGRDPALNLMTMPVHALIKRPPVTLGPDTPIRDAARLMNEQRVSSVLITQQDHLFGLVTDRDLRNRVIAADLDTRRPVADIATLAPMTIEARHPAFDALLLMARHNIHHVPVLDGQRIVGMITATDLTEQHSTSAVYLVGDVYKQQDIDGLRSISARIAMLQRNLAAAEASAYSTGHIITAITDAITVRLLQLGEARFGPAPVPYVWVAAGSQARSEQTAKSDQDNCMVIDDRYDPSAHGAYFSDLSRFVCDGLDACGYVHCPGEMMAMTDQWRQPRRKWAEYFSRWTGEPEPKSLMLTCVFFDLRAIHGQASLLEELRRDVLRQTRGNTIFLAHMVGNALNHQPPLGVFKGLTTIRTGEHKGTIDLKHSGIVPIVDLARIYALAGGDAAVNTHDRLLGAAAGGAISEDSARDLRDALEFLATTRIQHQARQIAAGIAPDNFLDPRDISSFERSQLKDAFAVVQSLQNVLSQRYQGGRF